MTPEEFKKIKEAEKEHLRSLRKLKDAVRSLDRQKRLTDAAAAAVSDPMAKLDEHDSLVDELAVETARNEAKLEIALENAGAGDPEAVAQKLAESEEELRKLRAKELVAQVRRQMGDAPAASDAAATEAEPAKEKTIGSARKKPTGSAKDEARASNDGPLPEKTIGRMKR